MLEDAWWVLQCVQQYMLDGLLLVVVLAYLGAFKADDEAAESAARTIFLWPVVVLLMLLVCLRDIWMAITSRKKPPVPREGGGEQPDNGWGPY